MEEEVKNLNEIKKSIKDELGEKYHKEYLEIEGLLDRKKIKKCEVILSKILGEKTTDRLMTTIRHSIEEKVNSPLPGAKLLKKQPDGLEIYKLQTKSVLNHP